MSLNAVNCSANWFDGHSGIGEYQSGALRLAPIYIILVSVVSNNVITQAISILIAIIKLTIKLRLAKAKSKHQPVTSKSVPSTTTTVEVTPAEQPAANDRSSAATMEPEAATAAAADEITDGKQFWDKVYDSLITSNGKVLFIQGLITLAHYFYVIIQTVRQHGSGLSGWQLYEFMFARVVNSGVVSTFVVLFIRVIIRANQAESAEKKNASLGVAIFLFTIGIISPALVTHIIPMAFAYLEISVVFVLTIWIIYKVIDTKCSDSKEGFREIVRASCILLLFALGISLGLLWLQMMFNYGVLIYAKHSYIDVMRLEFQARNTNCYLSDIDAQTYSVEQLWNKLSYLW